MFMRTNQRGFIFLELAIGLPLIILLLWSMGHLFVNTWSKCRTLIADLTLQMEVQNAMLRITDDLRTASHIEQVGSKWRINSWLLKTSTGRMYESSDKNEDGDDEDSDDDVNDDKARLPIYYFVATRSTDKIHPTWKYIYRQRRVDAKDHPLTGLDILSNVNVTKLELKPKENSDGRLWYVTIEAKSEVSGHTFKLKTAVYAEGMDR